MAQPIRNLFSKANNVAVTPATKYQFSVRKIGKIENPDDLDIVDYQGERLAVEAISITTPPGESALAIAFTPRTDRAAASGLLEQAVRVSIEGRVVAGAVGIYLDTEAGLVDEDWCDAEDSHIRIALVAPRLGDVTKLVVRNIVQTGESSQLEIRQITVAPLDPETTDDERTLTLFYDTNFWTPSFDFAFFLMDAEIQRLEAGLDAIHVVFIMPKLSSDMRVPKKYQNIADWEGRRWRFLRVLVGLTTLFPAVTGLTMAETRIRAQRLFAAATNPSPKTLTFHDDYHGKVVRRVLTSIGSGKPYLRPRAPEQGLKFVRTWLETHVGNRRPIAITLRQYDFQGHRNSNIAAWAEFARSLDPTVYCPIIIPDTQAAMNPPEPLLAEFPYFPEASIDVGLRMAIYELAYLNMLVSNGPACLCSFSDRNRYLYFKLLIPDEFVSSSAYLQSIGYEPGKRPNFGGSKFAKWIWEEDSFPTLKREFDAMVQRIESEPPDLATP